ncbi:hypothetical protein BDQ12DRAFT_711337 [Crucibulum laeve]|uniref:Uncharacterized protein n=1 Tax=Crucibulum laeve TaxID=68775 RepID=A0A5C3M7P5_9AGAR|nr:hypothetical protein BDQ12DRAFT_711337 [Crucibulum laeve]
MMLSEVERGNKYESHRRRQHERRSGPSTPIEIPIRKSMTSTIMLSNAGPTSPELLFDMSLSPISADYPSPAHFSLAFSPSRKFNDHEPFMYSFPFPTHRNLSRRGSDSSTQCSPRRSAVKDSMVISDASGRPTARLASAAQTDYANDYTYPTSYVRHNFTNPTTKIIGFVPLIENQPTALAETPPKPVLRPPGKLAYPSSPWILPGKSDSLEQDLDYSPTDPNAFDFQRHLLERLENQRNMRLTGHPLRI